MVIIKMKLQEGGEDVNKVTKNCKQKNASKRPELFLTGFYL